MKLGKKRDKIILMYFFIDRANMRTARCCY